MQQPVMLIVLVLAIIVPSCRSQDYSKDRPQQVLFQKLLHLDDVVLKRDDHALSKAWVTSVIDCSRRCAGTQGCVMSTFQPGQEHASRGGSCQLYGQLPNATMDQEASPGARSYVKYEDPDRLYCAASYSRLCGRCLRFVATQMNFADARQHCRDLNSGSLMVVRSREELDCVRDFMTCNGAVRLWVGASDLAEEGRYVWEDGTDLPVGSPLWDDGAPWAFDKFDCILYNAEVNGLNDNLCSFMLYVMCQGDL